MGTLSEGFLRKDTIRILELQYLLENPDRLSEISASLMRGGIVVYPTETLYGIGGDPFAPGNPGVRISRLKQRPISQPFIFLIPDLRFLEERGIPLSLQARRLARRFWPGPLTLILAVPPGSPLASIAHERSIAVRVSPHPFVRVLFRHRRFPLISTSANLSGNAEETARDPEKIREIFGHQIDLLVVEGYKPDTPPSTILDARGNMPVVLRKGAVRGTEIWKLIGTGKETP